MNIQVSVCHYVCSVGLFLVSVAVNTVDQRVNIVVGCQRICHEFVADAVLACFIVVYAIR